ncbi:hypothetical protein H0E84_13525 [Luteimonas sp. SJ-92]|uniref:Uncharacterized protein n=1 Tax=Luteimonas salinisoli TaxID=2752307 RepID=A0A853JDL6_9GAMM|nr:hypothetical protein [Luteimonas salinisoli]NZA27406.1 hypothetical protein [Luteimonas salinisoli]
MEIEGMNRRIPLAGIALALSMVALGPGASGTAQAQFNQPFLYCFVSPNEMQGGPLGRCTSMYPSPSYSAYFAIHNLPAANYSFVWTNQNGQVLPCNSAHCTVNYIGGMAIGDTIHVNYTNLQTGASNTLSRALAINGPLQP